jgi:hypothetical protein
VNKLDSRMSSGTATVRAESPTCMAAFQAISPRHAGSHKRQSRKLMDVAMHQALHYRYVIVIREGFRWFSDV